MDARLAKHSHGAARWMPSPLPALLPTYFLPQASSPFPARPSLPAMDASSLPQPCTARRDGCPSFPRAPAPHPLPFPSAPRWMLFLAISHTHGGVQWMLPLCPFLISLCFLFHLSLPHVTLPPCDGCIFFGCPTPTPITVPPLLSCPNATLPRRDGCTFCIPQAHAQRRDGCPTPSPPCYRLCPFHTRPSLPAMDAFFCPLGTCGKE